MPRLAGERIPEMPSKTFQLGDVLTVTTGRLLTVGEDGNGISRLYELLEHMTGEPPYTHSLGRFSEECKPYLMLAFPQLEIANQRLPVLDEMLKIMPADKACTVWLEALYPDVGREFDVEPIPADAHESRHPVAELVSMMNRT